MARSFDERIWLALTGWPTSTSSSPVEITAIAGRRETSTLAEPPTVRIAISGAPMSVPGISSAAPCG